MLYYDVIDISEGIDPTKSKDNIKYMICYYWFFNHRFKFLDYVCNGCHDLAMLCLNIIDIAIIIVEGVGYCSIIHDIIRSEAIRLLENSVLDGCECI